MISTCLYCGRKYDVDILLGKWNKKNEQKTDEETKGSKGVRSDLFCSYECGKSYLLEKTKQTNLKKYGCENAFQVEEFKQKAKRTCLKKYGVENVSKSEQVKNQKKATFKKHYNCDYGKSEVVKNKTRLTNLKRYGVEYSIQNSEVKEKVKQTNLERYGVENVFQSKEIQEKIKQTYIDKYGVTSNMQVPELYAKNLKSRLDNGCLYSSKMERKWLDTLNISVRQKYIAGLLVDGFDESTKTIYEFLGDKWHSNPNVTSKGEIFTEESENFVKTLNRFKLFCDIGYRVIYCWEYDWLRNQNLTRVFNGRLEY